MQVLTGLGPDFNSVVVAATTKEHLTLPELESLLLTHEQLLQSQAPASSLPSVTSPSAYYTNSRPKNNTSNGYRPNSNGFRFTNNSTGYRPPNGSQSFRPRFSRPSGPPYSQQPRPNPPLLPNPTFPKGYTTQTTSFPQNRPSAAPFNPNANEICQVCDKRGHTAKECWYRYDSRYGNPNPQNYQAFIAQPTPTASTSEWCLDSGASHHVTSDLNLSSYAPFDGFDTLHIGNGTGPHNQDHSTSSNSF